VIAVTEHKGGYGKKLKELKEKSLSTSKMLINPSKLNK